MAREFLPTHSSRGLYGGIARSISENEIFRTMTKGTTKNSSSQRYGSTTTRPRPVTPKRRRRPAVLMELTGHHHRAGRVPREIHLLVPGDGLGMARRIGLSHAHHLARRQLDQINRQVAEIRDVLHRTPYHIVGAALRRRRGHEDFLRPHRRPYDGFRRRADSVADVYRAAQFVRPDSHVFRFVFDQLAFEH